MSSSLTIEAPEQASSKTAFRPFFAPPEKMAEFEAAVENLVTEDDAPVDSPFSELQMGLLTETLRGAWRPLDAEGNPRKFVVMADVGLFYNPFGSPIVPDVMLSLDIDLITPSRRKASRAYFLWEYGKAPEVAVEIVSNREGEEDGEKMLIYASLGVRYYVIHDPKQYLSDDVLRIFRLEDGVYERCAETYFPEIGLGMRLWEGNYGGPLSHSSHWLRWCYENGDLVLNNSEQSQRAEEAERRAEEEEKLNARLLAKLREMGIDPEQL